MKRGSGRSKRMSGRHPGVIGPSRTGSIVQLSARCPRDRGSQKQGQWSPHAPRRAISIILTISRGLVANSRAGCRLGLDDPSFTLR